MNKITMPLLLITCLFFSTQASASWLDKITEALDSKSSSKSEASAPSNVSPSGVSTTDINAAFKQALELGSKKVVEQLGKSDGFNADSLIRITLPDNMQTVKTWLGKVGLDGSLNDLEVSLNRAAENAVPKAQTLFVDAIKEMTFEDVKAIYRGESDAATRYFQSKMTPSLTQEMTPVVEQSLSEVGAVNLYDDVMGEYKSIPFVPDVKADLVGHVVTGGLDGIFHYLAKEEAEIRKNPVKRSTELLKRVFGSL